MRGLERLLKQNSGGGKARSRVGNAPIRTRLFYGGRTTLLGALGVVAVSVVIGVPLAKKPFPLPVGAAAAAKAVPGKSMVNIWI